MNDKMIKQLKKEGYLTIGGIGHRDPSSKHIESYKQEIAKHLAEICSKTKLKPIVITPIADGADRLLVEVAKERGIAYAVLLPLPVSLYIIDFDQTSKEIFDTLVAGATAIDTVDLCENNTLESIVEYAKPRDLQYREAGKVLAQHCDELIALWDGKVNNLLGGTADIIDLRQRVFAKNIRVISCKRGG